MKQLTNRERIQKLAINKGHCLCSESFTCPCKCFKDKYKCHCAGDDTGMTQEEWVKYNLIRE